MITNMKNIKNLIDNRGVKPTYHRIKILEYLMNHENHPTVDIIYENIIGDIPTISKTTVYNTLNLFADNNLIKVLNVTGTETRYDANTDGHHHFLCKKCGGIYNVNVTCTFACEDHNIIDGNEIHEIHSYFKGICKKCLEKQK